ncbi:MetQ/NlpA family ABC transporter substrate-binding protein [Mycoplasma sp. P36-A1]|uniref:MetQ/NlpA family ABC transporter substrate-binding protein n=1 Tax=Mycoplasma sp. P36-A1 TaxID=3252900 RepID=UPI003C2FC2F7
MKKILGAVLALFLLVGCSNSTSEKSKEAKTLSVSATSVPHAEILEQIKPTLKEKYNIDLDIQVTDDYFIPNKAVDSGDVDANFFQHIPFLEQQIAEHGYKLVNAGNIHIEPIGIYSKKYKSTDEIKDGSTIIISNSVADHGRILSVLETAGLIKLKDGVDKVNATLKDIVENPKKLEFKADIAPEMLSKAYENNEADLVAINSNYALDAGLSPTKDAIIIESTKDNPYVNIVAVKEGNENDERIKALISELKSDSTKKFIEDKYKGSVIVAE